MFSCAERSRGTHDCKISQNDEQSYLPKLRPCAPKYQHCIRYLRKMFLATRSDLVGNQYIRSTARLSLLRKEHIKSEYWYIIHPLSVFTMFKNAYMTIMYLETFIVEPFIFGFLDSTFKKWSYVNVLFLLNIVVNFFTGYVDNKTSDIVLNQTVIVKRYLKSYFFTDFLASVLVLTCIQVTSSMVYYRALGLGQCLVRLIRIGSVIRNLSVYSDFFRFRKTTFNIFCIFFLLVIFLHTVASLMFGCATILMEMDPSTRTWLNYATYKTGSVTHKYTESLMVAHHIFLGKGTTYNYEESPVERIVYTFVLIAGCFFFIYVVLMIILITTREKAAGNQNEYVTHQINEFFRVHQLPKSTKNRVLAYYNYGYQQKYFGEKVIWQSLSDHLKHEIIITLCMPLIKNAFFFKHLPKSIIGFLIARLQKEIYLWNDVIYKVGDMADCLFVIMSGSIALYTADGDELSHISDNNSFGDGYIYHLRNYQPRGFSAVATEISEIYKLNFEDVFKALKQNPDYLEVIVKKSKQRWDAINFFAKNKSAFTQEEFEQILIG